MMFRVIFLLVALAASVAAQPRKYRILDDVDIKGQDIPSKGKAFTKICYGENGYGPKKLTGVEAYQAMCDATRGCVAFSLDDTDIESCAFMKKAGTKEMLKARKGWWVGTTAVKPMGACKYDAGGKCSTDQFAEPYYCCGGNHVACVGGKCVNTLG